jgi:hypothetical protein
MWSVQVSNTEWGADICDHRAVRVAPQNTAKRPGGSESFEEKDSVAERLDF